MAAICYLTWIPAIYLGLLDGRRNEYLSFHVRQALLLWTMIFIVFFAVRLGINAIWSVNYIPHLEVVEFSVGTASFVYAAYCAWRSFQGIPFSIPH